MLRCGIRQPNRDGLRAFTPSDGMDVEDFFYPAHGTQRCGWKRNGMTYLACRLDARHTTMRGGDR